MSANVESGYLRGTLDITQTVGSEGEGGEGLGLGKWTWVMMIMIALECRIA